MKYYTLAITIREKNKYYAYTRQVSGSDNLLSVLRDDRIAFAQIAASQQEAKRIADLWNASYTANGENLYAEATA